MARATTTSGKRRFSAPWMACSRASRSLPERQVRVRVFFFSLWFVMRPVSTRRNLLETDVANATRYFNVPREGHTTRDVHAWAAVRTVVVYLFAGKLFVATRLLSCRVCPKPRSVHVHLRAISLHLTSSACPPAPSRSTLSPSLCTTFEGGGLGTQAVLVVGVSTIVADGLSMGLGEYLSSKAMNEYMDIERKREEWELANHRQASVRALEC